MARLNRRREFLQNIGIGMLVAGVGTSTAAEMGCSSEFAESDFGTESSELNFGKLNPLVDLMQERQPAKLQEILVRKLAAGETNLRELTAAASLANAETFGGQDYVGYHTEMAMMPALQMSSLLEKTKQALPVLKVIYRNAQQTQKMGGEEKKTLRPSESTLKGGKRQTVSVAAERIRTASRNGSMKEAETCFASMESEPLKDRLNAVLPVIQDDINVHRFVLAHRAYELIDLVGKANAQTMLRQCVRYCVDIEQTRKRNNRRPSPIRTQLPKLVSQFKLDRAVLGNRDPGVDWIEEMATTIYDENAIQASEAVAAAIAEGIAPDVIAESISVASNWLVLRQGPGQWRTHGDSAGVHASDAANAWRQILPVSTPANRIGGLLCSTYHTAQYRAFQHDPYPTEAHRLKVKVGTAKELLGLAEECIRGNDQASAAAAIQVYVDRGFDTKPVFDLMLRYAISEDGRLHAEKYFRTVYQEYQTLRPRFRTGQLVALARVTASSFGYDRFDNKGHRADGYEDACRLLKIES